MSRTVKAKAKSKKEEEDKYNVQYAYIIVKQADGNIKQFVDSDVLKLTDYFNMAKSPGPTDLLGDLAVLDTDIRSMITANRIVDMQKKALENISVGGMKPKPSSSIIT